MKFKEFKEKYKETIGEADEIIDVSNEELFKIYAGIITYKTWEYGREKEFLKKSK